MILSIHRIIWVLALCWLFGTIDLQAASGPRFIANKKQWPAPVQFRADVPGGSVFLTASGFVYDWRSTADLHRAHEEAEKATRTHQRAADVTVHGHAVFVDFQGAAPAVAPIGELPLAEYHNYFLGRDASRWASQVPLFEEVRYPSLYPGTDLRVYGTEQGSLKYDFVVRPGGQPATIALRYRGAEALHLRPDGSLLVRTSVTDVVEQRPYAYQLVQGHRQTVECRYRLTGNVLHYDFPQGYDTKQTLIIDPAVVACSYSGSTGEVWGAAAGYDNVGNIYTAGYAQGQGYPTTPGAYQAQYRGNQDVAISKLNPTGSQLLYATYLGGAGNDEVRALRATNTGELYVLTQTTSNNFPVTVGSYNPSFNGGLDIAISRLNATGTSLVGSTYLGGGSEDKGIELALDAAGTGVVVVGSTASSNFPTTAGAFDRTLGGGQDAFVASRYSSLTTLRWGTFLGGNFSTSEAAVAVHLEASGTVLVAGSTTASDFPVTTGALRTTYAAPGDGFVARLRADGSGLLAATFFGSLNSTDQITHVVAEANGSVGLCGVTNGTLAATSGALSTNGSVFVAKLSSSLGLQQFLAKPIARLTFNVTAFGLDGCGNIYLAGFDPGSGAGLPVVDALPNGSSGGFYTTTLNSMGSIRLFGSYFGPSSQHAHTSSHRFDGQGRLYQSVCTTGSYPTTPTAYTRIRRSNGFDVLVFKIDQSGSTGASVQAAVAPVDSTCAPSRVTFANSTTGSRRFRWSFADGSAPDTARNPVHVFQNPGTYQVQLVAFGTGTGCSRNDTTYVWVRVKAKPTVTLPQGLTICPGGSLTLSANSPGSTYRWNTSATTASIFVTQPGKYVVTVSNGSCNTRDSTTVRLIPSPILPRDTTGCITDGVKLTVKAEPGSTYLWSTQATTPSITATTAGRYTVRVIQGACVEERAVVVRLLQPLSPPNIITPNGDGRNDVFKLSNATTIESGTRLRIYNRWGREVYATDNYGNDWNAASQVAGVYYYTIDNARFCTPHTKGWLEVVK